MLFFLNELRLNIDVGAHRHCIQTVFLVDSLYKDALGRIELDAVIGKVLRVSILSDTENMYGVGIRPYMGSPVWVQGEDFGVTWTVLHLD